MSFFNPNIRIKEERFSDDESEGTTVDEEKVFLEGAIKVEYSVENTEVISKRLFLRILKPVIKKIDFSLFSVLQIYRTRSMLLNFMNLIRDIINEQRQMPQYPILSRLQR